MSWKNITLRPTDRLYSQYIRQKHNYTCEHCGIKSDKYHTEASHFWSRKSENTRFDERNVKCLLKSCHKFFHENRKEYEKWMLKKLGKKEYDKLMLLAHTPGKRDDVMIKLYIEKLLKDLEN